MLVNACVICVKRLEVGSDLQCRAAPPRQDVGRYAVFPTVKPNDFCHDSFVLDAAAQRAQSAAADEQVRLDQLSAMTAAAAPLVDEAGQVSQCDLAADLAQPQEIAAAEGVDVVSGDGSGEALPPIADPAPHAHTGKARARRARPQDPELPL